MKNTIMIMLAVVLTIQAKAQGKTTVAVMNIEATGLNIRSSELTTQVRIELEKLGRFYVMDKRDLEGILKKNNLDIAGCTGKNCLVEAGKLLGADKIVTGSINRYDRKIVVEMRMVSIADNEVEKTEIDEFLPLEDRLSDMIHICLSKMLNMPIDNSLQDILRKQENLDNAINNPGVTRLVLSGPRIGITYLTGNIAQRIGDDKSRGGLNAYPYMTIFGYQHEIQYLNEGNFQALFEFVGAVGGLDQNMINPSLSILDGFRSNINGWEFALGPNFSLSPVAQGYYDDGGQWVKLNSGQNAPEGKKVSSQLDARGTLSLSSSFVFAVGKSFRSGKMNIPVNLFVIPKRDGWRMGMSFGFNAKRREI